MKMKFSLLGIAALLMAVFSSVCFGQETSYTGPVGTTITLLATADGNPAPTFQWRKNAVDLPGATSSTLVLAAAVTDSGAYSVKATNEQGSALSPDFPVTFFEVAPEIAQQPADHRVPEGASVTLSVVATGTTPTYQWRKDGTAIAGAIEATLILNPVKRTDAGLYDCVVTNSAGSVTTRLAAVDVLYAPGVPTIKVGLKDLTVRRGQEARFEVVAENAIRYAWRDNKGRLRTESGPVLAFKPQNPSWAGWWTVEVYGTGGMVPSSGYLTVVQ